MCFTLFHKENFKVMRRAIFMFCFLDQPCDTCIVIPCLFQGLVDGCILFFTSAVFGQEMGVLILSDCIATANERAAQKLGQLLILGRIRTRFFLTLHFFLRREILIPGP